MIIIAQVSQEHVYHQFRMKNNDITRAMTSGTYPIAFYFTFYYDSTLILPRAPINFSGTLIVQEITHALKIGPATLD